MNFQRLKFQTGFTLLELLISITIVAVLAAVAIPSYLSYLRKSAYSEVVQTADSYKVAIAMCIDSNNGVATNCDGGSGDIPANIASGNGLGVVDSVTVTDGVITIVPRNQSGISASETYILTPTYSTNGVTWAVSGGVCGTGYVTSC